MPLGIGAHASVQTASGTTAVTPARNTGLKAGTIFLYATWVTGTFTSITSNVAGNTFTQIGSQLTAAGTSNRMYVVDNAIGSAAQTFTLTLSASTEADLFMVQLLGTQPQSFDQTAQGTDAASPFTLTGPVLTLPREIICVGGVTDSGSNPATWAESTGFTLQEVQQNGTMIVGCLATKIVSQRDAPSCSFTNTGATNCGLFMATFKEFASGSNQTLW